ncbi:MAG: PEGA domain protein [Methanoregulaceae archaeon PtaU1.Bin059]|nr:MAG: PEGA domain protein [Methanoregulaceae archaeon PtaB.Bin152]OPY40004.1 MAG: PEGA domain protein [Methanoregulaceae archaeon PtaU1.Bin059]
MDGFKTCVVILGIIVCLASGGSTGELLTATPGAPATLDGADQGYFLIDSFPRDADVYFDGKFLGETPVTVAVSTTGKPAHEISLIRGGYEPWSTTYQGNPRPGQTATVMAILVHATTSGAIQVISLPPGAASTLDRTHTMETPCTFAAVPIGDHEVSVYLPGYQTYYTSVNVRKGETAHVIANLSLLMPGGALSIGSTPGQAAVHIDGTYRGVTPHIAGNLAPGQHSVKVSKAGYVDWTGEVEVVAGVEAAIAPTLGRDPEPLYGTVSIISSPPGADVYADGVYLGQTRIGSPLVYRSVLPCIHEFHLAMAGYQDSTSTGVVRLGENYDLAIPLNPDPRPATGRISLLSQPSGADLFLNNVYRGPTPATVHTLMPGSYDVLVRLPGYQDWQAEARVAAGETVEMNATLIPIRPGDKVKGSIPAFLALGGLAVAALLCISRK